MSFLVRLGNNARKFLKGGLICFGDGEVICFGDGEQMRFGGGE